MNKDIYRVEFDIAFPKSWKRDRIALANEIRDAIRDNLANSTDENGKPIRIIYSKIKVNRRYEGE